VAARSTRAWTRAAATAQVNVGRSRSGDGHARRGYAWSPRLRLVTPDPAVDELDDVGDGDDERLQGALMSAVLRAAQADWRAARWLLETRWPDRFGLLRP
jgi:hypothetical protein